eukprot:3323115-Amphidinium_carterae.1
MLKTTVTTTLNVCKHYWVVVCLSKACDGRLGFLTPVIKDVNSKYGLKLDLSDATCAADLRRLGSSHTKLRVHRKA